jgi:signal transduction histidine kinase
MEDVSTLSQVDGAVRPGVSSSERYYRIYREAVPSTRNAASANEHAVQFYEADAFLEDAVADYIGLALGAGDAGIVVATKPHREGIEARLGARGLDPVAAQVRGSYVALDAAETLSTFMVDGTPDPLRFVETIGAVLTRGSSGGRRLRVFGEMVALLAVAGNPSAALRLEQLWNDLQRTRDFSLYCAYPMNRLGGEALGELLDSVCVEHSRVIPAESYTTLPTRDARLRTIATLQQKARWLEAEIAERKRAEERLRFALAAERAAVEAAEAALRQREEFLSIAAHELKTPITTLSGQAQLLLRRIARGAEIEPERVARTLEVVKGESAKLALLVNRLLDISRLDAGKLTLERQTTDLALLVEQAVSGARARSSRHTFVIETPDSVEINADVLRLEQVLANLLDNAIKYSPDGGEITVSLRPAGPDAVEISVRDHGLGIPPEKRGQIFERFYQAHANGYRSGLGLGLYISREIVELHGGEIRVEFPADGGSRFSVRLPIDWEESSEAGSDSRTDAEPALLQQLGAD